MANLSITIKDVFVEFKGKDGGVDKQFRLLFARQSMPINCPACNKSHSVNELHVSHPEYIKNSKKSQRFSTYYCPETDAKIKHQAILDSSGDLLKLVPEFYYEWGTEPTGMVSTGVYINNVYHSTGLIEKSKALADDLKFHNPQN